MLGKISIGAHAHDQGGANGQDSYCASPISGMGTTLALQGAYNLAGALSQRSMATDYASAFAFYEERMRPIVDRAQKLPLGAYVDGHESSLLSV